VTLLVEVEAVVAAARLVAVAIAIAIVAELADIPVLVLAAVVLPAKLAVVDALAVVLELVASCLQFLATSTQDLLQGRCSSACRESVAVPSLEGVRSGAAV